MAITVTFDPPLPSDSPSVFNTKAFTLLGDLNDWSTEANSLASTVSSNASTSTTNASNASTSADAAATSASNAAASYDSFDDRYLGSKSSAPTLDNDGAALLTGALYWDSVLSAMFVRTSGGAWTALNASTGIAQAITVNSSSAALTVTQTGAGNAFVVEDSASADSTPFVIDAAGRVGIGIAPVASTGIYQVQGPTGAATCYGHLSTQTIQSDVTSAFRGFQTNIGTAAAAFTISAVNHFLAGQATLGASSAITTQVGFLSGGANIGATTNIGFTAENTAAVTAGKAAYGFYSAVNTASGGGSTYGFYAAGTAPNYFGGNVTVGGGGTLGYGAGSGGTVTQATSKSTSVTLNKPSGQITMHNAALAAGASVSFQLNNTAIASGDVVVANGYAVGTSYIFEVQSVGSGAASIRVTNVTGGSLSDALGINFNVIKGSAT